MSLINPEARRALRTVLMAIVMLWLLWLVSQYVGAVTTDQRAYLLYGALGIIGVNTFGNLLENGIRAFEVTGWGVSAKMSAEDVATTAVAAATAVVKADKENEQ